MCVSHEFIINFKAFFFYFFESQGKGLMVFLLIDQPLRLCQEHLAIVAQ